MKTYGEFLRDDTGAVTIDWVALTAGILLLGIMVVYAIFNGGVASLVGKINATLATAATAVDVGIAPALYDMELASGDKLPAGSVVTDTSINIDGGVDTTFTLADGSTVTTSEMNATGNTVSEPIFDASGAQVGVNQASGGLPIGTTVNSGNSITLADGGGTVTQSSLSEPLP